MTTLFQLIVCLLQQFASLIAAGVVAVINALITSVGTAVTLLVALLPSMPDWPTGGDWAWLNWATPVSSFVGLLGSIATLMAVVFLSRVALRWVKAL
jgi:hypothetical protein